MLSVRTYATSGKITYLAELVGMLEHAVCTAPADIAMERDDERLVVPLCALDLMKNFLVVA